MNAAPHYTATGDASGADTVDVINFAVDIEPLGESELRLGGFWSCGREGRTFFGWPRNATKVAVAGFPPPLAQLAGCAGGELTPLGQAREAERILLEFVARPNAPRCPLGLAERYGRWLLDCVLLGCASFEASSDAKRAFDEACSRQAELCRQGQAILRIMVKFLFTAARATSQFQQLTYEVMYRPENRGPFGFLLKKSPFPVVLYRTPSASREERDRQLARLPAMGIGGSPVPSPTAFMLKDPT